ncbi:MAG: 50S ribosomal protein L29 [Acidimicrobiia bacterium]|nr:50S ribosomal protein L29 [Acidimicrobiia bacterium]
MSAGHLRDLAHDELVEKLDEAKEELFNLRFQLATNQLDNSARIRAVKKEIARISTVIREQEIEAWHAQQAAGKEA